MIKYYLSNKSYNLGANVNRNSTVETEDYLKPILIRDLPGCKLFWLESGGKKWLRGKINAEKVDMSEYADKKGKKEKMSEKNMRKSR